MGQKVALDSLDLRIHRVIIFKVVKVKPYNKRTPDPNDLKFYQYTPKAMEIFRHG